MADEATQVVAATAAEDKESVQAAYDRIANPGKVQDEPKAEPVVVTPTVETSTAEEPPEPAFTSDQIKGVMAQVARIPELEKQLRDAGGRYGALKQSLEQLQQRMTTANAAPADVEDMLKDIKDEFGEDGLYASLKSAFSKVVASRSVDPDAISKIVSDKVSAEIEAIKHADEEAAIAQLTELRPTWMKDRETPEFPEWVASLPEKERNRFNRSKDPDYVAGKLEEFDAWKAKKVAATAEPTPAPTPTAKPTSKRLQTAVLPTNGTKPKAAGEDDKASQVRAAYERVAGARR